MSCEEVLHINDEGTILKFNMYECNNDGTSSIVDITSATNLIVRFRKSDVNKTVVDKQGSIYTGGTNGNGTDGIIQYITEPGFVDVTGLWKAQAIVTFPTGTFHSDIKDLKVVKNL